MENKNGQGIFLGVVAVATLVVAIIGATFAYFSASSTAGNGVITGQTLGGEGAVMGLSVTPVKWEDAKATSNDLVPAAGISNGETNPISNTSIQTAINAKCEAAVATSPAEGDPVYTGCHLYKITASTASNVKGATLAMTKLETTNTANTAKWKYALFKANGSGTSYDLTGEGNGIIANGTGSFNVGSTFTTTNVQVFSKDITVSSGSTFSEDYYLLVYVENIDGIQNATTGTNGGNNVTGTYNGEFTFSSGTGTNIQATFAA